MHGYNKIFNAMTENVYGGVEFGLVWVLLFGNDLMFLLQDVRRGRGVLSWNKTEVSRVGGKW